MGKMSAHGRCPPVRGSAEGRDCCTCLHGHGYLKSKPNTYRLYCSLCSNAIWVSYWSFILRCLSISSSILEKECAPTATDVSNASLMLILSSRSSGERQLYSVQGGKYTDRSYILCIRRKIHINKLYSVQGGKYTERYYTQYKEENTQKEVIMCTPREMKAYNTNTNKYLYSGCGEK